MWWPGTLSIKGSIESVCLCVRSGGVHHLSSMKYLDYIYMKFPKSAMKLFPMQPIMYRKHSNNEPAMCICVYVGVSDLYGNKISCTFPWEHWCKHSLSLDARISLKTAWAERWCGGDCPHQKVSIIWQIWVNTSSGDLSASICGWNQKYQSYYAYSGMCVHTNLNFDTNQICPYASRDNVMEAVMQWLVLDNKTWFQPLLLYWSKFNQSTKLHWQCSFKITVFPCSV